MTPMQAINYVKNNALGFSRFRWKFKESYVDVKVEGIVCNSSPLYVDISSTTSSK